MENQVQESNSQTNPSFNNILVKIHFDDPQEVAKKETGLKLAKAIYEQQWTNDLMSRNFFAARAAHQLEIEKWSLGKQDMTQFLSFMGVNDANKSEANIDMTPIMTGAQFVGTTVESISKNTEYPWVTAVDEDSTDEKIDRQVEAIFRMREAAVIDAAQQASGIQLEPSNAYVPDTELAAKVYFEQKDQLPKEIKFQKILSKSLDDNQYEKVLKPKLIRNNVVFNMEVIKVGRGMGKNEYIMRACIPKNTFYNYFLNDSGNTELSYIGEGYNLKVKDIRKLYGKTEANPKGLTEEEIYKFAKLSRQNNPVSPLGFNWQFGQQYGFYSGYTPWDDFTGFVIDFEIKISESNYWVSKVDNYGKENITSKKGVPKPTGENSTILKKEEDCVYRCVYSPYANMTLYWGRGELKNKFTCSINIPYNNGEYVPSLFERALEPLKRLALLTMKEKLLIARLSPTGFRIDVEGAKNIITGNGRMYEWEDIVRVKTITGIELYSSKGLNPLEGGAPAISTASQDSTLQNIIALDQLRVGIINEIRELMGVPVYLDGSNVGQRTAAKLSEGQREATSNVNGFILNSHHQVMEEALNNICLMAWQDVVTDKQESAEDMINTKFKTYVKLRITDEEKTILESDIARWSVPQANGKPLLTPADCYAIRQIDDLKLAEMYLAEKVAENERKEIADSERLQKQNGDIQQQSLAAKADFDKKAQDDKIIAEKEIEEFRSTKAKELALLNGFMAVAAKDESGQMIQMFLPALQQLVPNIQIPLTVENQQMQQQIQQAAMAQQQAAMQQEQQQQGGQDQQDNQQGTQGDQRQQMP